MTTTKALTVLQPYASLIACNAKHYETRSWRTKYRGKLVIHAGKYQYKPGELPKDVAKSVMSALTPFGLSALSETIPYSAVIAVADLMDCWRIESSYERTDKTRIVNASNGEQSKLFYISEAEYLFGDWTPGRYAWELTNVERLPEPIPCKGKQGLWNWKRDKKAKSNKTG